MLGLTIYKVSNLCFKKNELVIIISFFSFLTSFSLFSCFCFFRWFCFLDDLLCLLGCNLECLSHGFSFSGFFLLFETSICSCHSLINSWSSWFLIFFQEWFCCFDSCDHSLSFFDHLYWQNLMYYNKIYWKFY